MVRWLGRPAVAGRGIRWRIAQSSPIKFAKCAEPQHVGDGGEFIQSDREARAPRGEPASFLAKADASAFWESSLDEREGHLLRDVAIHIGRPQLA
jgi:hypothetical protein